MSEVREAAIVTPGWAVVAPTACFISCFCPTGAGFCYSIQCPPFLLLLLCICFCFIYTAIL